MSNFNADADQKKVIELVSIVGTPVTKVRDEAKERGVERPLGVIKKLLDRGLLERVKDKTGTMILMLTN